MELANTVLIYNPYSRKPFEAQVNIQELLLMF